MLRQYGEKSVGMDKKGKVVNGQSPKVNLEDAELMKHIRSFL